MTVIKNALGQAFDVTNDVPYRNPEFYENAPANANRCRLDITIPKGQQNFPTVVWFHGGGLTGGSKHTPIELTQDPDHPCAVIACGYRLANVYGATGETCLDDAAAATAWVLNHIAEYGGDPKRVFVSGHSAGAYLTSMIGMDPRWLRRYNHSYRELKGLLPLSGQCVTHFTIRAERNIPMVQATCDDFAPIYHAVTPDLPPILLITGDAELEMCGRQEENAYFCRMLKLNGQKDVTHYTMQGYGHNMVQPAYPLCVEFIRRVSAY